MHRDRNARKLEHEKTKRTSVEGAMHGIKKRERLEYTQKRYKENRRREKKREEIAKDYPWIGEVVREFHPPRKKKVSETE